MGNRLSTKEYQEIKNTTFTVVTFENGFRVMSHGGCNYKAAIAEILKFQSQDDHVSLLMTETQAKQMHRQETNWQDRCSLDEARRIINEYL